MLFKVRWGVPSGMEPDDGRGYKHRVKHHLWNYAPFLPYSPTWEHGDERIVLEEDTDTDYYNVRYETDERSEVVGSNRERDRAFKMATGYVARMEDGKIESILEGDADQYREEGSSNESVQRYSEH